MGHRSLRAVGLLLAGVCLAAGLAGCTTPRKLSRGLLNTPRKLWSYLPMVGPPHPMNHLAQSSSPYLRSAAHQPIGWYEWGDEAFKAAQAADRPILLDIGAVWCHWCHVIDRESYENPAIARLISEHFIPVKVDVDARPDIDRRYQEIVSALTGQGGWPLTVFLTPTGEVIFGGTYFPPEDRGGMPGMKGILIKVADLYRTNKSQMIAQAKQLHKEFGKQRARVAKSGELSPGLVDHLVAGLKNHFDEDYGGFGEAPKFPSVAAVELAMQVLARRGDPALLKLVTLTLDQMAAGGLHDQLGGAFHRYSTDRRWRVPHFEIMLTVNAELLAAYTHAYQLTKQPRYREVAEGIIAYVTTTLSDQARGGFYGSQDADDSPHDDGDYYTWTMDEAKAVLSPEDFEVLSRYYDIRPRGEMRENPAKNVLSVAMAPEAIAEELKRPVAEVQARIARGRTQLLKARQQRPAPFVDPTIYVHWNGLMISAYLEAAAALDRDEVRAFALKTLDRILNEAWRPEQGLSHTVVEGRPGVPGLLEDYVQLATACAGAYQATQDSKYLTAARMVMEEAIRRFWDEAAGGFFDLEVRPDSSGVLRERRKPIQDAPTPSGNGVAVLVLQRLAAITGEARYRDLAQRTLRAFAGNLPQYGIFAATLGQGVDRQLNGPAHVVIIGAPSDPRTQALLRAAAHAYQPGKVIQVVDPKRRGEAALPPPVREVLQAEPPTHPSAYVCLGTTCRPPVTSPEALTAALQGSSGT